MGGRTAVEDNPHNVASGVDPIGVGEQARDGDEHAIAQQKAIGKVQYRGSFVAPDDVASGVDPRDRGINNSVPWPAGSWQRKIDGGERPLAQQKAMSTGGVGIASHDVALGVDPRRPRAAGGTRNVDGGELSLVQ